MQLRSVLILQHRRGWIPEEGDKIVIIFLRRKEREVTLRRGLKLSWRNRA